MASTPESRIDSALTQLIECLVPVYPSDDDAELDERLDEAFTYASDALANAREPVAPDINHAHDQIKRKLIRENGTPEKALRFGNLYSRLLAQPVLSQKWAMLYFLFHLGNDTPGGIAHGRHASLEPQDTPSPPRGPGRPFVVDSPSFNAAFSKPGLLRLPERELQTPPQRQARPSHRPSKEPVVNGDGEPPPEEPPPVIGPSEAALLRDLPFTLQGLSSTNLVFTDKTTLKLPNSLPVPIISLLHVLAEPSLLYSSLSTFVESTEGGLVGQSSRAAIGAELRSYLGLVATLEGQIRRALATLDEDQSRKGLGKAGVTLRRCSVWTRDATQGLRLLSHMVEESKGKKGGELISLIHSYSLSHGDPFVGTFAERLLSHVTRPFYDMLRSWIYDGELSDPYLEFFVVEQQDSDSISDGKKGGATSVWEDKYKLNPVMVPSIITDDFADKVFLIGKSLNFIRYGCGDSAWVEGYSKSTSRELRYGNTATLSRSISEAYKTTMARLTHLMEEKFHLSEHLKALKRYLLLGAGDFIAVLMESLSANLDRPANTQYRHTLTAQLEHAVRNSNAQYDSPDVLRRLDSRMLELSHGEIGWDVFTLEYKIDAPVDVIVTPHGSKQYLKVFNFLWRVKRVEFALSSTWRRCATGARGVLGSVADTLGPLWKHARCAVAEMIHFVNQLQYYILFEVIESSWTDLAEAISKPDATLDNLIAAHAQYLRAITRKGLLGSSSSDFTGQLHELFKVMLAYKDAVDGLYSFSVAEFTRRQDLSAKIETRTASGKWGISELHNTTDSPKLLPSAAAALGLSSTAPNEDDMLPALRQRLRSLAKEFKVRVNVLLGDLGHQPDADMRWLAMVMNFNDVYQPVRRKRAKGRKEKEREQTPTMAAAAGAEKG